jgi:L-ribulokinase
MVADRYAIGLDFGTNSVRALLVNVRNGNEVAESVAGYAHGREGILLDAGDDHLARQHPSDWLVGMEKAVQGAIQDARKRAETFSPESVIGIGVDTTGSTPLPLDKKGIPLAMHRELSRNLNAHAWLWKDHTSFAEAEEITALARRMRPEYLSRIGGVYSSEWFFSKILHCLRKDKRVFRAAHTWAECSDYIPFVLTGGGDPLKMKRNVCAAGHKAMYNEDRGLPDERFLAKLSPEMPELRRRLYQMTFTADRKAGGLAQKWARRFGLRPGIPVAVGAMDAHMGAVGSGIRPGTLVKIIGTSTCDMMVVPLKQKLPDIPGLCGIVNGSILPGYHGLEAGQSAVGDIFNWYVSCLAPRGLGHDDLTKMARKLRPGENGLLALDWNNGNRTVLVDPRLTGMLVGQTLHTRPEEIYRALIEATAFGARVIINRFEEYGVKVREVTNCGGISEKNDLLLQIYADALGRPMKLARSAQACALGAAIFASVAAGRDAGGYSTVRQAQQAMCGLKKKIFRPIPKNRNVYDELFALYQELHDTFGGVQGKARPGAPPKLGRVMKELLRIKDQAGR